MELEATVVVDELAPIVVGGDVVGTIVAGTVVVGAVVVGAAVIDVAVLEVVAGRVVVVRLGRAPASGSSSVNALIAALTETKTVVVRIDEPRLSQGEEAQTIRVHALHSPVGLPVPT